MSVWTTHRDHGTATWNEVAVGDRIVMSTRGPERTEIEGSVVALTERTVTIKPWIEVPKADFDVDRIFRQQ